MVSSDDAIAAFVLGLMVGVVILGIILSLLYSNTPIALDKTTGNDICHQLTGNSSATATSESGKLICELPSYDSTQNIIIRKNNEDKP